MLIASYHKYKTKTTARIAGAMCVSALVGSLFFSCGVNKGPTKVEGALSSLMEPHALPEQGPWFEGWYARLTPSDGRQPSIGLIIGSHLPPGASSAAQQAMGLPGFVSVLVSQGSGKPLEVLTKRVSKSFLLGRDGNTASRDPVPSVEAEFAWQAEGVGSVTATTLDVKDELAGWRLQAQIARPRRTLAWDVLLGPAGPASLVRALPLHWFIYGMDLSASWKLTRADGTVVSSGAGGRAHFEKNWGRQFPSRYIWLQGHDAAQEVSVAGAGGALSLPGGAQVPGDAFLIVVTQGSKRFVFSPANGGLFSRTEINACDGRFVISMSSVDGELMLSATAPRISFGTILIPTGGDFQPGSEQSFATTLRGFLRTRSGEVIPLEMNGAGLEFGGGYKCRESTDSTPLGLTQ